MGYFPERTRVRIDEQGLVRISIRADQTSVDEYVFSYAELDAVQEAYEYSMDIRSSNIRVKKIPKGYSVQIKEGPFKRRIYDFSTPEFQMMMNQFLSQRIHFEKMGGMSKIGVVDPVDDLKTLSVKLESSFERLYEEIKITGNKSGVNFDLENVLTSINDKLNAILDATKNINITTVQGQDVSKNTSIPESDDFFIPSTFEGESFRGKVTNSPTTSTESTDSASEALKELRKSKKGVKK